MGRRYAGLAVLCLYALVALADTAVHLRERVQYGLGRLAPERVIVATEAGLFWPADLVAAALLAQG
jgi:hypothetical protein